MYHLRTIARLAVSFALMTLLCSGCVATKAIPVRKLNSTLLAKPRAEKKSIDFSRLAQDPPKSYILGPGDILGVFVEGALGEVDSQPPAHYSQNLDIPPATGYPVPVSDEGTIDMPLLKSPLHVAGLTLPQTSQRIRETYVQEHKILADDKARTIVTLMRKRRYQVLVVREDSGSGNNPQLGAMKRGSAMAVNLDAFENDVLHALAATGGLPGLDANNELIIIHRGFTKLEQRDEIIQKLQAPTEGADPPPISADIAATLGISQTGHHVTRIPLRIGPDDPPLALQECDIVLATGDIVYLESREREVYYTGGLLQGKEILLPRDYDLDVMAAIALAGNSIGNGPGTGNMNAGGGNVLSGSGMMNPRGLCPPTQVIIVRKVNGSQVPIKVSLSRTLVDPRERILIKPGDMILLQYTPSELIANIILNNVSINYFINSSGL